MLPQELLELLTVIRKADQTSYAGNADIMSVVDAMYHGLLSE